MTDTDLVAAYNRAGSVAAVAASLGVSRQAVHERLTRIGAPIRTAADKRAEADRHVLALVDRENRGPNTAEIAEALGITERAARFILARLRERDFIRSDGKGGFAVTEIGRALISSPPPQKKGRTL